jgi:hypothetical protein
MKQSEHPVYPKAEILWKEVDGRVVCDVGGVRRRFTRDQLVRFITVREEGIRREAADPYRYGYRLGNWGRAEEQWEVVKEMLILGGNRSSKTEYASWLAVRTLVEKDAARVWCLHSSSQSSVALQQPYVYKYLPPEWKVAGKKGVVTNISYTQKNGFSENTFVCPNGSQCWFLNYCQDWTVFEGGECDLIWCDELVPLDLLRTLRYRLVTRGGRMLTTFTPIEGYTPTIKEYLTGAVTLVDAAAPLLVKGGKGDRVDRVDLIDGGEVERVPLVQEARNTMARARIVYFHTSENPWGGYENLRLQLERATREEVLCRAYGVPVKAIAGRFPKFQGGAPHVVVPDRVPKEGTNYQIVDPCSGRNWFMVWVRVDVRGRYFVYREWPCESGYIEGVGYPGAWAVAGKKTDGERGPAQKAFGFGLLRYKEEIERLEGEEKIFERLMDSRFANSSTVGKELVTTLLEECAEVGMHFSPAPGEHIDEGVDLVNDMLDWDEGKPVDAGNEPRLFVSEQCTNTIWALKEWTGADGRHGACKDPVDCLRYAVLARLEFLEGEILNVKEGGSY